MTEKIAFSYIAIFAAVFLSRVIGKKVLSIFGMESIIFSLSILFPVASILIASVQIALNLGKGNIVGAELVLVLATCHSSYFLYRRSKGLEAVFGVTRVKPSDGQIGCLTDFLIVGITVTFLVMGVFLTTL